MIVITGISVLFGYWVTLPHLCPKWRQLLEKVSIVHQRGEVVPFSLETTGFQGKGSVFPRQPLKGPADFVVGVFIAIVFYVVKVACTRSNLDRLVQVFLYAMLVSLFLPYVYLNWEAWDDRNVHLIGNWLGTTVAILTVPTGTFVADVVGKQTRPLSWILCRSTVELLVATPIWAAFWGLFSFWILGFGWI